MNNLDVYLMPYADDDETLNDWVDDLIRRVMWQLFENQEDWLYMAGEKGTLPVLKDNALDYIRTTIQSESHWLVGYIVRYLIAKYRLSNIELSQEAIDFISEDFEDIDGGYETWEEEARRRIYREYKEVLGEEKVKDLVKSWWGDWECGD